MEVESVLVTGNNRGIGLKFVRQLFKLPKPPKYIFSTHRDRNTSRTLPRLSMGGSRKREATHSNQGKLAALQGLNLLDKTPLLDCELMYLSLDGSRCSRLPAKLPLFLVGVCSVKIAIEFVDKQEPVLDAEATKADKQNFELRRAKAPSTICLSIDENLKSIVYNIDSSAAALQKIENVFEPRSRARIGALGTKFLNILFLPSDTMSSYIGKISQAAKDLENAGKVIPDDEISYQICSLKDGHENYFSDNQRPRYPGGEHVSWLGEDGHGNRCWRVRNI
ncbi:hypothetical protein AVEN_22770-1 [Araneus ventricosus]|uniref:Uncharacterized protein n=1 Tax=Araneus ventricosus TaxID=182803 RepID=A0A4Y2ED53_ARAVE|nr:hypothetical protein AVEN_22770-1 [Araneus ventricosus]